MARTLHDMVEPEAAMPSRLRGLLLATFALVTLVSVGFWGVTAWVDREQTTRHTREQAQNTARILQEHVRRTVATGDLVLARLLDRIRDRGMQGLSEDHAVWQAMHDMVESLPEIGAAWIHDADGISLLTSRQYPTPPTDVSARPYFQVHASGIDFHVGERIVGKLTGQPSFTISRRIEQDRRFIGVAHVNVAIDYYREVFESLDLGPGATVALARDNGQLVFRFPIAETNETADIAEVLRHVGSTANGVFDIESRAAGTRTIGYQRVPGLPLVVLVGLSRTSELAAWHERTIQGGIFVALTVLVCGALALAAARSLARERVGRDRLAAANTELDTAARRLEEANRAYAAANRRMNLILHSASDSICGVDRQGRLTFANPATSALLGFTNEELQGRNLHAAIHHSHPDGTPFPTEECAVFEVLQTGRAVRGREDSYWRRDGTTVQVEFTASPMLEDGRVEGAVVVFREIAERKRAEEALHRAMQAAEAASRAKSEFLANMSHEIRTPMNAILGLIHLIQQTDLSARQRDYIQKIRMSAQSLLGILNDILDFSKVEANKLDLEQVEFRLDELLQNLAVIVGAAAQEKDVEVLFRVAPDVPLDLIGDPLRLQQVLINLAGNAIKFTDEGEVVVSVTVREVAAERAVLTFSVRDTGIGIAPEQKERLFQAFSQGDSSTTRRYGGTGLGLAICTRLVTLMGGSMDVESEPGRGSDFHFDAVFARQPGRGGRTAPSAPPARAVPRALSVLVVDDNQTAREVLADMAGGFGWTVTVRASGIEALAELERAASTAQPYDIVLMDWKMPGMDGIEAARRIRADRQAGASIIIVVSAYGRERVGTLGEEAGVSGFLVKPVTASTLLDAVTTAYAHEPEPHGAAGASPGASAPPPARTARQGTPLRGRRLLLVEDNAISQEVAREILERAGARVTLACNGREAVARVEEAAGRFDAVLMDVQMPEMDGFEATRALRRLCGGDGLPIIAMTASALPADRKRCLEGGMNDHVAKPLDVAELFTVLGRWVGMSPDAAGPEPVPAVAEGSVAFGGPLRGPAAGLPGRLPGIDLDDAMRRLDNDTALFRRFVGEFARSYAGSVSAIERALAEGNLAQARQAGHDLKGVAGNIGARRLSQVADAVQTAAAHGDSRSAADNLPLLKSELAMVLESAAILADGPASAEPTPSAAGRRIDSEEVERSLRNFATLLHDSNFAAAEEFAMLAPSLAEWVDPSTMKALAAATDSLDFPKAHGIVQRIARDLGLSLSTV